MTSSAERVRRFRDRQRQANPKEPLWRELTGKLNVAATWLSLDLAVWNRHPNKTAREEYLKGLYRRLAGRHHPDKGGDTEQFRIMQVAYEYFTELTHLRYF